MAACFFNPIKERETTGRQMLQCFVYVIMYSEVHASGYLCSVLFVSNKSKAMPMLKVRGLIKGVDITR